MRSWSKLEINLFVSMVNWNLTVWHKNPQSVQISFTDLNRQLPYKRSQEGGHAAFLNGQFYANPLS